MFLENHGECILPDVQGKIWFQSEDLLHIFGDLDTSPYETSSIVSKALNG